MVTAKDTASQVKVPGEVPEEPDVPEFVVKKNVSPVKQVRAKRSPHPGVVLTKPDSRNPTWRARCEDPDTGKRVKIRLDPMGAGRNAQTRKRWAIDKAREIAKRIDALNSGAPRATGTKLADAVARYYEDHPRLRDRTKSTYAKGTDKLVAWCETHRVKSADELTLAHLVRFRASLSTAARARNVAGRARGTKALTDTPRSASAVNVEIRSVKAVLRYLRSIGLLPRLSRDDISDGLRLLPTPKSAPQFLRPPELKSLLLAANDHDAEKFEITREEHHGERQRGTTPRYPAIAPVIAVTLLSGMRFGEVAALDWSEVDLEAGEIRLGTRTKTKHARTITFEHSPALASIMAALHKPDAKGNVWKRTTEQMRAGGRRLGRYGAPDDWNFQALRRTCGTFLTNAPGIFGGSSAYRSARLLGHSVAVAEKHYLGVVRIDKEAATLEAAMGIEGELAEVLEALA